MNGFLRAVAVVLGLGSLAACSSGAPSSDEPIRAVEQALCGNGANDGCMQGGNCVKLSAQSVAACGKSSEVCQACTNAHGTTMCSNGACVPTCSGPWGDCDGNPNNGCGMTLSTTSNCSGCGITCDTSHSWGASCDGTSCHYTGCRSGHANCRTTAPDNDGCETDIATTANCGSCGHACGTNQACSSGTCTCIAGTTSCGSSCVDLQADTNNCGACGNVCLQHKAECNGGACCDQHGTNCVCSNGQTYCAASGACKNLQTDSNNCGACGNACPGGVACTGGVCACAAGQASCGGVCLDVMSNHSNCGSCGNACGPTQVCVNGGCHCSTTGLTACGPSCVNPQTDTNNCGACGRVCTAGDRCCSGVCSDVSGDAANCGACGVACAAGTACDISLCCPTGQSNCGGVCVDAKTSNTDCGVCGRACTGGMTCVGGSCTTVTDAGADAGVSDASAEGGSPQDAGGLPPVCINDPCNPYCTELNSPDGPITSDAMTTTVTITTTVTVDAYNGSVDGFGGCPAGFHAKEVNFSGCLTGGQADYSQCNTDWHCEPATGQCVRSAVDWTYPVSVCPGINLTASGSCTDPNTGLSTSPVCNRGNTTLSIAQYPTIDYYIVNGNHFDFVAYDGISCPVYGVTGSITLPKDLEPGECINLPTPPAVHGNSIMYLNSNGRIPECGAGLGPTTGPGCYDNWADVKTGGTCVPQQTTTTVTTPTAAYAPFQWSTTAQANCDPNSTPTWELLMYDTAVPANPSGSGSVLVEAHAAVAGGSFGSWVTVANTAANDPAVCAYAGPAPACPKDLYTALGADAIYSSLLELRFTLTPTPDGQAIPVLKAWQAIYSCMPNQ